MIPTKSKEISSGWVGLVVSLVWRGILMRNENVYQLHISISSGENVSGITIIWLGFYISFQFGLSLYMYSQQSSGHRSILFSV